MDDKRRYLLEKERKLSHEWIRFSKDEDNQLTILTYLTELLNSRLFDGTICPANFECNEHQFDYRNPGQTKERLPNSISDPELPEEFNIELINFNTGYFELCFVNNGYIYQIRLEDLEKWSNYIPTQSVLDYRSDLIEIKDKRDKICSKLENIPIDIDGELEYIIDLLNSRLFVGLEKSNLTVNRGKYKYALIRNFVIQELWPFTADISHIIYHIDRYQFVISNPGTKFIYVPLEKLEEWSKSVKSAME